MSSCITNPYLNPVLAEFRARAVELLNEKSILIDCGSDFTPFGCASGAIASVGYATAIVNRRVNVNPDRNRRGVVDGVIISTNVYYEPKWEVRQTLVVGASQKDLERRLSTLTE